MIHSGVWGFASSPIVTEDEIRRVTLVATEVARASAIAKKFELKLAPVPAYVTNWATPMVKHPNSVSQTDKQAWAQAIVDKASKVQGVTAVNVQANHGYEWRYFASTEGSYIEQELYTTSPSIPQYEQVSVNLLDANESDLKPATAAPGGAIAVSDTTRNQGAAPAEASTTVYFLSSNPTLDAADVVETLRWACDQPWSNGRIGTMGLSYAAHTQGALGSAGDGHLGRGGGCRADSGGDPGSAPGPAALAGYADRGGRGLDRGERAVVLVRRARAELVEAVADAPLEVRNHRAHVMRDDLQSRMPVEQSRKNHARHRRAGAGHDSASGPSGVERSCQALSASSVTRRSGRRARRSGWWAAR